MKKKYLMKMLATALFASLIISVAACGKSEVPKEETRNEAETKQPEESTDVQEESKEDETAENSETIAETEATVEPETTVEPEATVEPEITKEEAAENFIALVSKAANASSEEVRYYLVDDFDSDSRYEGFLFVGDEADPDWGSADGEIWFVNESGSKKIHDEFSYLVNDDGNIFSIIEGADKNFVAFNDMYATAAVTNLYYMDGDTCRESDVSRIGSASVDNETGDLLITVSAYDCYCDYFAGSDTPEWTGHSWKPYYFYYSRNTGDFMEYGAKEISADEYKELTDKDLSAVLDGGGYVLESIIQRDNGIINVNYSKTSESDDGSISVQYLNATYDTRIGDYINAWGYGEGEFFESDYGGSYYVQLQSAGIEKP